MTERTEPVPRALLWDERALDYDFGPEHPFQMVPRRLAVRLLESTGPLDGIRWERELRPAPRPVLELFHTPDYLDRVEGVSVRGKPIPLDAGDTPGFPGCFEAAARIVAGTVRAVDVALEEGGRAWHPAGGLHHAHRDAASGFCVFNDVAVGIERALRGGHTVAYLDLDAHHGDGVMYGFYGSGRLLDIDFHQDGRTLFPGTGAASEVGVGDGAGWKVNVPLPPGAGDDALLSLFPRLVPVLLREFRPELIVVQHGADGHLGDPLSSLRYTSVGYDAVDQRLTALADELSDGRLVVTGGGGYRPAAVSRVFARAGAWALRADPPPREGTLSAGWRAEFEQEIGAPAPARWADPGSPPGAPAWTAGQIDRLVAELERGTGLRFPAVDDGPGPD